MSLRDGQDGRDAGMRRVMNKQWTDDYRATLEKLPTDFTGIGEDFRNAMTKLGLRAPNHHNSWGANFNAIIRAEILEWTGETAQMKDEQAHARSHNRVYRLKSLWER